MIREKTKNNENTNKIRIDYQHFLAKKFLSRSIFLIVFKRWR